MTTPRPESSSWGWLEDTYWCVPPESLPAVRFNQRDNTLTWLVDQTVWHLTGSRLGYFWGVCGALLRPAGEEPPERGPGSQPQGSTMLGSITPEGRIHLTFITGSDSVVIGLGDLAQRDGGWAFEMQMSTTSGSRTTAHWAYMVQVRPGDPAWDSLPGTGLSVSEMLDGLEPPAVEPPERAGG